MFNVGDKVYWNDPDDGICSGEFWVTGKHGSILYLTNGDSDVEAYDYECDSMI